MLATLDPTGPTNIESAPLLTPARTVPHIASLDGVRGLAVLAVMHYHSRLPGYNFGWIGVDMFFALSGFLITNLLIRERQLKGRIDLPKFWGRRFLRLMPAYWAFIGICTFLMLRGVGTFEPDEGWTKGWYIASLWGYFTNYAPVDLWKYQEMTGTLWSLSVEEQFYLTWPFICAFILAKLRRPWIVAWILVLATFICRLLTVGNHQVLHTMLYTRGICLVAGCSVALSLSGPAALKRIRDLSARPAVRLIVAAASALFFVIGTVLMARWGVEHVDRGHIWFTPVAAILFPALLAILWYGPRDRLARTLSWRPLVYVGQISYGIYLYHALFKWLVWDAFPQFTDLHSWPLKISARLIAYFGGTILLATISYYVLEQPFLKLKNHLR